MPRNILSQCTRLFFLALAASTIHLVADHTGYSASAPSTPVPKDFFAMHLINKDHWPTVPIGALGKGTLTGWTYVERSRGSYDWSNLDAWVAIAEQHGVDFFFSFEGIPEWAASSVSACYNSSMPGIKKCHSIPKDLRDFDNFVTALVTRYRGRIKYYELWNEPYTEPMINVADLVVLTDRAYKIIRLIDTSAKIISPSLYGQFAGYADRYYAAGGVKDVDIISLHTYPDPRNDIPEVLAVDRFLLGPLLPIISKYDLQNKPIWSTEGSWGDRAAGAIADPDQQMAFIARSLLLHWSNGVTRFYWYAWDSANWGTLWDARHGARKAAKAYNEVQNWMLGAMMTAPCGVASDQATWTCGFSRPESYRALVIWNTQGNKAYIPSSEYVRFRDLDGTTVDITGAIIVGQKPIILETR